MRTSSVPVYRSLPGTRLLPDGWCVQDAGRYLSRQGVTGQCMAGRGIAAAQPPPFVLLGAVPFCGGGLVFAPVGAVPRCAPAAGGLAGVVPGFTSSTALVAIPFTTAVNFCAVLRGPSVHFVAARPVASVLTVAGDTTPADAVNV